MKYAKEEAKEFEKELEAQGYKRYNETWKNQEYSYYKSFKEEDILDGEGDRRLKYQIAYDKYDFSKYPSHPGPPVSYQLSCYLDDRKFGERLSVNSDMSIPQFEEYCRQFYLFTENLILF